jgi:hypothetical protein
VNTRVPFVLEHPSLDNVTRTIRQHKIFPEPLRVAFSKGLVFDVTHMTIRTFIKRLYCFIDVLDTTFKKVNCVVRFEVDIVKHGIFFPTDPYLATRIQELCKNFKIIECTPKWDESYRQEREGFGTRQLQQTLAPNLKLTL